MNWIDKLERKYGRYAIKNLVKYLVIGSAFVFALTYLSNSRFLIDLLQLDRSMVLKGQVWRLITFIFVPQTLGIFIIFVLYLFYVFGNALERFWGSFRFNLYYLIGIIAAIAAAFISGRGSAEFLNLSIFLAFAYLYPNYELLLFFILPVKVKYLAWFNIIFILFSVLFMPFSHKVAAVLSFANFFVFFGRDIINERVMPKVNALVKKHKRKKFKVVAPAKSFGLKHKCRVCGRTSEDYPQLKFGYCLKCGSDYEYCQDHLKDHDHVN